MPFEIHVHHHFHDAPSSEVIRLLNQIISNQGKAMATLDDVLSDVKDESTQIDSLSTLMDGIKQQLADALSGASLPPNVQAKVDAVFAGVEANKAKVVQALNAGTPAANVPTS